MVLRGRQGAWLGELGEGGGLVAESGASEPQKKMAQSRALSS